MKITDTTPKPVERTFTVELTETELYSIVIGMGLSSHEERVAHSDRDIILGATEYHILWRSLREGMRRNDQDVQGTADAAGC